MLSLPPAFVLSQDQTLKFNVLLPRKERDPVTNYSPILLGEPMRSSSELATAETFALLKRKRPPPLAYPFPNRRCIERTTLRSRPFGERAYLGQEPFRCKYAQRFFYAPFSVGAALIWGWVWGVKP